MSASPSVVARPLRGRRILFWADAPTEGIGAVVGLLTTIFTGSPPRRPEQCVDPYVPLRKRQQVAKLLAAGEPIESYFGHANCRMCGVELGHRDFAGYGFIWPEKAEHYLLEHGVWTPECDLFFQAAREELMARVYKFVFRATDDACIVEAQGNTRRSAESAARRKLRDEFHRDPKKFYVAKVTFAGRA